ncbi:MAG: MarR family transcriptional regulator [Rhizobiaceae bacterium]|nr:MarR family transcriptional regulator [Rhizobiaceae bacterium]
MAGLQETVKRVRAFNRFYTRRIGLLNETLAGGDFTLTETRVLLELRVREPHVAVDIARDLGLDPAYLARILRKFHRLGLVTRSPDEADGRRRLLALTEAGRRTIDELQAMTERDLAAMLASASDDKRQRLTAALDEIETVLGGEVAAEPVRLRPHRPGDMGWVIEREARLYADEYGWDITFEGLVAEICANFIRDFRPGREFCWIAKRGDERLGAVFLVQQDDHTAKLRLLHVEKAARGQGVGSLLVRTCIEQARASGYRKLVLWTNDVLASARRIYQAEGFQLVGEEKHRSFGKGLVGQYWELAL